MENFKEELLKTKKVSVWGIGYLGYTSLLKLQDYGLYASIYDFNKERLSDLLLNKYPNEEQFNSWSKNGKVPQLNLEHITVCDDINIMFKNNIHIISFPNTEDSNYSLLVKYFIENVNQLKDSLVIFQSVGIPTKIEQDFSNLLKNNNIEIDISTVFRSDWIIEDFFAKDVHRVISGNSESAYKKAKYFLSILDVNCSSLKSIEEAEVYENVKNALNYTIVAFFNQLSLSYPHIDINELSKNLTSQLDLTNLSLGVSSIDYKSEQSIENLFRASIGDYLSILRESNNTNIAFLFYYVDLLKSKNVKSVTIFGLSSYNSFKDIRMSPSVILAEYLNKNGIEVIVCDDSFAKKELNAILPYCKSFDDNKKIESDAVIIMNINNQLKFFNQNKIEQIGLSNVKFMLDNTGFFKEFRFSNQTIYHQFGDSNLVKVIK